MSGCMVMSISIICLDLKCFQKIIEDLQDKLCKGNIVEDLTMHLVCIGHSNGKVSENDGICPFFRAEGKPNKSHEITKQINTTHGIVIHWNTRRGWKLNNVHRLVSLSIHFLGNDSLY
jgi:hypothetical protein